jgi:hypothetical protein
MNERMRLLNRRASQNFSFWCNRQCYSATTSYFPDGRLAEIFLSNGHAGSDLDSAARDSAVVVSIALQYSVPLDVIRRAILRNSDGTAATPIGVALDILAADEERAP